MNIIAILSSVSPSSELRNLRVVLRAPKLSIDVKNEGLLGTPAI